MPRVYSLAAFNVSLAGLALEGFDASEEFTVSPAPGAETIREDIRDAVLDALYLERFARRFDGNPEAAYEDWNALGMSDPVSLPPLELKF